MIENNWHAKNISEVLHILEGDVQGLSPEEAKRRLVLYGANELELFKTPSILIRFLRQFHNILIYVLLFAAVVTLFLGRLVDTWVILIVVILNAIFGFIQEGKAEKAIEAIRKILAPHARVVRNGRHFLIPAKNLVVGDVVLIKSGDKVPADLRLFAIKNLQIQESILTGESNAVEKGVDPVSSGVPLGDRFGMAYGGTTVTYGKGTGVVVATGINTEIGKVGRLLENIKPITTPLLQQIGVFGRWLTVGILSLTAFTFLIGILVWHDPIDQMFMAAVGLAVAAIPEGLPPLLTIILAIGVTRMAKCNAIIRQLPSVETMGAVTVICTDKTGTLTRNEQTVKSIITSQNSYDVKADDGMLFSLNKAQVVLDEQNDLLSAIHAVILCNDAEFTKEPLNQWHIYGNPIDKAFLEMGNKAKIDGSLLQKKFPRVDMIPYESEHKFMATLHHSHGNQTFLYVKGAPEHVLVKCAYEISNSHPRTINYNYWHEHIETLARQGYRVIAVASKAAPPSKQALSFEDVTEDLTLIAIFGLIDAPRLEAVEAVAQCHRARIKVKMITGDHAVTAATIATQVGIDSKSGVLTGGDIDKMSDSELAQVADEINVYARTSPHHKLRLVQALQANGELVAMTGDGVNDAPALRKANIGIAMGHKGAEIAKEAAAMVLADDNFATIVNAIREGRIVYDNLRKVMLHILPTNIAESIVIVIAVILGVMLPITPVQILWINMITAVVLSTALGFEPAESNVMNRAPRTKASILSTFLVWRVMFVTILLVTGVFGLFILQLSLGMSLPIARTMAVNMMLFGEIAYLFNCRKLHVSIWRVKNLFDSKPALIAVGATIFFQMVFTYFPIMQKFFKTAALNVSQWLYIILFSLVVFILVEIEKFLIGKLALKGYDVRY